ncbi:MAG: ribonuclease Z [Deltaproteobacteria bacterium]|nr:MAG: ribonuclease Z [Deltaproteobacteria bacterium]
MSVLRLTFLGTSAAQPTVRRGLSATYVRAHQDRLLIDCGEGTQRQMLRYGTGFRVDFVLFTHFHADHYLGIVGFLRTLAMGERSEPMTLYGPAPFLDRFLRKLVHLGFREMPFPLHFEAVGGGDVIQRPGYAIHVVEVEHRMPALGFVLEEPPRPGRFDVEAAKALGVPEGPLFGRLQRGETVTLPDGRTVRPEQVLGEARPGRRIAVSGDTRPCTRLAEAAHGADLLVHEATFSEQERDRALETHHSTALEAGRIAARAGARHLVLTHLSSRYDQDPDLLREEAARAFDGRITVAFDGLEIEVPYRDAG